MLLRLMPVVLAALVFSGCATTQMKTQNDQIQARLTDLEKNLQAKDAEIVDLQYQVKDLSSKVDSAKTGEAEQAAPSSGEPSAEQPESLRPETFSASQIIRVRVGAEKIQRALKAAGVYTGAIDGKIGPGTKEAIVEFQKSHGLKADGVLGHRTWEELKTYLK